MKGKFIKKLTAYALTAAMVVSTPMTAFASEFADNFYQSSGNDEDTTHTDTGTVSSTDTETNSSTTTLKDYATDIKGIKISPASVAMNVGEKETLEAEVIYTDESKITNEQKKLINKRIRWESSNREVVTVNAMKYSMNKCPINANKPGFSKVTASLDYDYDGTPDIIASVNVMVKRNFTKDSVLKLDFGAQKFYAGHTYDLRKFTTIDGEQAVASDDIAYTMTITSDKKDAKKTSVNGDGILSVDKAIKSQVKATLTAVYKSEDFELKSEPVGITMDLGTPVTKLAFSPSKDEIDLAKMYTKKGTEWEVTNKENGKKSVTVAITNKDKGNTTTDDFTWVSSDEKVAKVANIKPSNEQDVKTELSADIIAVGVGKAKITVTSTSNKKATFNVTVKATLLDIESVSVADTWSGKTTPIIINRVPAENNDKLKITVNKDVMGKADAGLIKIKNQNVIPAADLKGSAQITANIKVQSKDYKKDGIEGFGEFIVKQSNVTFDGVARAMKDNLGTGTDITTLKQPSERLNPSSRTVRYYAINPKYRGSEKAGMTLQDAINSISWESSSEKVATVDNGNITVVGEGTATITVSCVSTMKWSKKNGWEDNKGKIKQTKKSFKIKSTPKCTEIVLKTNSLAGTAGSKVTLNVKQQLPKKAADAITWYVDIKDGNGYKVVKDAKNATDKKFTYTIPSVKAGTVISVLATTGSVSTEATIEVVNGKLKKVDVADAKNGIKLGVGAMTIIGDKNKFKEGEVQFSISPDNGENIVGYEVDKNGATVVKVLPLKDGRAIVCGISEGKGNITAITASGKKAKVKVEVTAATTAQ